MLENDIRLLFSIFSLRGFYVLGAGASYNLTPLTSQFENKIIQSLLDIGNYSVIPIQPDLLTQRVIRKSSFEQDEEDSLIPIMLERINPGFSQAKILYELANPSHRLAFAPPQYEIFNLLQRQSFIFNLNLDGLAEKYCSNKHIVVSPHGVIPTNFGKKELAENLLELSNMEGYKPIILPKKVVFMEKEPENILDNEEYILSERFYSHAEVMVFIGYSFGNNKYSLDDHRTFYFFQKLMRERKIPILVISPTPEEIVFMLRDSFKQNEVRGISASWPELAKAIFEFRNKTRIYKLDVRHILRAYNSYMNSNS